MFNGDDREYEMWEARLLGYMKLQGLKATILPPTSDETQEDADKQDRAYAELTSFLDKRSLGLVMRDAKDNGRKALAILRGHYAGTGKPRIATLYTELMSLKKETSDNMTDFIIKAEQLAESLRAAGEVISDGLLVAVVMKGLPAEYQPFIVVTTQNEAHQTDFTKFKSALRNFEETENTRSGNGNDNVMFNRGGQNGRGKGRNGRGGKQNGGGQRFNKSSQQGQT